MTKGKKIRIASTKDTASILEIYEPFITDTSITFEFDVPTESDFKERISNIQKKYPWIVCEIDGNIAGYAYASSYNERAAYDWSVDLSIYINPSYQKKKIGKSLYYALLEILKLQGFCNAVSLVTVPNENSEKLHKSFGFKEIGVFENIGFKFEEWKDVRWLGLKIQEYPECPLKPKRVDEIKDTSEFKNIIKKAENIINY
jgi:phosphinothricin acetyltransferase